MRGRGLLEKKIGDLRLVDLLAGAISYLVAYQFFQPAKALLAAFVWGGILALLDMFKKSLKDWRVWAILMVVLISHTYLIIRLRVPEEFSFPGVFLIPIMVVEGGILYMVIRAILPDDPSIED